MNIFRKLLCKKIQALEKGKVYVLQIPSTADEEAAGSLNEWAIDIKEQMGIDLVFITSGMTFVSPPPGYELRKLPVKITK